ncbi:MAG TPA: zinc-binding dehydrogenase [Candidatus Tyrphobacter sp.]
MRVVRLHELGGPEKLLVEDVEVPQPSPDEVLVRVRAAALNHRDVFITRGLYPKLRLPVILGADGAGEVHALGERAGGVRIGDEVVIDPMLDWGDDPDVWRPESSILGTPRDGTFAQYVAVPACNVYAKPSPLTMEEAAALPVAALTAYRALFTRGKLRAGETVLITGVGGGVQTFVLLFAKHAGARTIVTSSSDAKLERAKSLGADVGLNYATNPDWQKTAKAAGPIDLAVDSSGGETLGKVLSAVRPGGRVAVYGGTQPQAALRLFPLFWNHLTIVGTSMGSPWDFRAMLELFSKGGLKPAIDRVFGMHDVVEATRRLEDAEQFGKIVLRID